MFNVITNLSLLTSADLAVADSSNSTIYAPGRTGFTSDRRTFSDKLEGMTANTMTIEGSGMPGS